MKVENWVSSDYAHIHSTGIQHNGEFELAGPTADGKVQVVLKDRLLIGHIPAFVSLDDLAAMRDVIDSMIEDLEDDARESKAARFFRYVIELHYPERLAEDPNAKALFLQYTGTDTAFDGACYCFAEALRRFLGIGGLTLFGYIVDQPNYPNIHDTPVFGHVMLNFANYYVDGNGAVKIKEAKKRWLYIFQQPGMIPQIFQVPDLYAGAIKEQLVTDEEFITGLVNILKGYEDGKDAQ